jgi:hypothetical protein
LLVQNSINLSKNRPGLFTFHFRACTGLYKLVQAMKRKCAFADVVPVQSL